ncbi:hypothetical protein [Denitromonas iodatirespirans]|uniref:Glycoside hydrolase family 42 N-terminal domain-containing protein n=1 Tax=Denitromonas iodatirespirans TaxID=2795389 RepID=A0A944D9N0_DENI1|nr:hypothetical protein [Denitromonas iodatirespirans]MBT0962760.1 hypothetical protein [Denitromonas iodatirespirans]
MSFVRVLFLFCALLMAGPVVALRCATPEALFTEARPKGVSESRWQVCAIEDERALHLSGVLASSLVRARGYVDAVFYDQRGRRLWRARQGPWLGIFSGAVLDVSIPVPAGATQVRVAAATESTMLEADGRWEIGGLQVVRGVVATLSAAGNGVITDGRSAKWSVKLVPSSVEGRVRLELFDVDGETVDVQTGSYRPESPLVLDFGVLPPGYYDARLHVDSAGGRAAAVSGAVAVLPPGDVPNEPRFGMDAALSWYGGPPAMVERSVAMMRLAGVGSLRDRLSWTRTQPARGKTDWGVHAEVASVATGAGLDVVQVFHDSPPWARGKASGPADRLPPRDDAAAFEFGRAYAAGLGRLARSVEYWNEQNSNFFAGYPFQYASGLKAFSAGVRSVDPAIRVLIGAAAGKPGRFFEETYRNGVGPFFDVRNQHFYGDAGEFGRFYADHVRGIEVGGGVAERPGWLTEIGYSLRRDGGGGWRAAELAQADYLAKTYVRGVAAGYERVFFFFWRELVEAELHTWGVIREDFSPRPAYFALGLLSRHLAGAVLAGVEARGKGRIVYFRRGAGDYVAVMWGGDDPARFGSSIAATDVFGRPVDGEWSRRHPDSPILMTGISALPPAASTVALPMTRRQALPQLRISAKVLVAGVAPDPGQKNRIAVEVGDGDVVEITGRLFSDNGGGTNSAKVLCSSGPGLTLDSRSEISVDRISEGGAEFNCRFRSALSKVGESYISATAVRGSWSDVVRVALIPDAAAVRAPYLSVSPVGECPVWVGRASRNVDLAVDGLPSGGHDCPPVKIVSRVRKSGETWVFPATAVRGERLSSARGLRTTVSHVTGMSPPPTPLLLQLVERSGGIWLVDLTKGRGNGDTLTGLFNLARPAPWARDDNGQLDLENVKELMLGWGGYGGQRGQRHAFSVESIEFLAND